MEWKKYDPNDRSIESHVEHLVVTSNGFYHVGQRAHSLMDGGYVWYGVGGYTIKNVTHWMVIKPPEGDRHE
jgi:hypothetical protein